VPGNTCSQWRAKCFKTNFQPIASERNATTCDFTERFRQLTHDVRVIELAVAAARKYPDGE
jgi:hypothetical protein